MSIWIQYGCDGNLNGDRCRRGASIRTDDLERILARMAEEGYRPLSDVLPAETHIVMDDEHLCSRTDHDEEQPGYGPEDWVRETPAVV